MRILHFFKSYWPEVFAGVGRSIDAIACATADNGIEHHILSINDDGICETDRFHGQYLHKAQRSFLIYSTDFSYDAFRQFNRLAASADVIHLHFPWPFMDLVHLANRSGKPTILTYHADALAKPFLETIYKPVMHLLLSKVDRIVATSPNYVATSAVLKRYSKKTEVIPLGLDPAGYETPRPAVFDRLRQTVGSDFFLFVGALRHYKGLDTLLRAAEITQLPVVVAGAGRLQHELHTMKTQLELDNVTLLGDIAEEDKIALLGLCKAFVFPSNKRSEAFGLSLVEAAMMGKPMISCEIGTGTSFVNRNGETGLVVPPDDPVKFAEAMKIIDQDSDLQKKMGTTAKEHFERELQAKYMGARYLTLYNEVIRKKKL